MKKILAILLLVLSFSLASCKGNDEVFALVDEPDTTIAAELGLSDITVSLNTSLSTESGSYVDIKVSSNLAESLIVRDVLFDDILNEHINKIYTVNVGALTFVSGISDEYKASIESELNNETYGITAEKLNLNVELISKLGFSSKISLDKAKELYGSSEDNIYCSVIYLPIRAFIYNEGQNVLSIYVLVPMYAEFGVYENSVHSNTLFDAYKSVNYSVNSSNVIVPAE